MRSPKSKKRAKAQLEATGKTAGNKSGRKHLPKQSKEKACYCCSKDLSLKDSRALFVEEEVGRVFCSENCIVNFFSPEIKKLEKEYFKRLPADDLVGEDKKKLSQLRWVTLQEPNEIWREKVKSGDLRYTLISQFNIENQTVWEVCICLFLRGEPSFLFLAFPTADATMVASYRRGERIQIERSFGVRTNPTEGPVDGLASEWTQDETLRAKTQSRSEDDIPVSDFGLYQRCAEETLEVPDEVWSLEQKDANSRIIHFLRCYPDQTPEIWYIVVAKEVEDDDEIEILEAFPTRDLKLVESYRQGKQQLGKPHSSSTPPTHTIH